MTERERWIVYPLLFMSLGISLKPKIFHEVETGEVLCKKLQVVDDNNQPLVELSGSHGGGAVTVVDADGNLALVLGHMKGQSSLYLVHNGHAIPVLGNLQNLAEWAQPPMWLKFPWLAPLAAPVAIKPPTKRDDSEGDKPPLRGSEEPRTK